MDRTAIEAQLRQIIASAEATKVAAESALRELSAEDPVPRPPNIPEPTPPPIPEPEPPPTPEPQPPTPDPPPAPPDPQPPQFSSNGEDTVRLMALKMAIDGSTREQIEAELTTKYGAGDRAALLDEVLARAGR